MKLVQLDILQSSSLAKFADFVYNCIMHGIWAEIGNNFRT